jgi:hypothetical protein
VPKVVETKCPLCGAPRRGPRCACNYVFEYEGAKHSIGVASGQVRGIVLIVAIAAACLAGYLVNDAASHDRPRPELGLLLVPVGAFSVAGAWFGWGWFLAARRARLLVAIFGAAGARIFYALIGGGLAGAGVGLLLV